MYPYFCFLKPFFIVSLGVPCNCNKVKWITFNHPFIITSNCQKCLYSFLLLFGWNSNLHVKYLIKRNYTNGCLTAFHIKTGELEVNGSWSPRIRARSQAGRRACPAPAPPVRRRPCSEAGRFLQTGFWPLGSSVLRASLLPLTFAIPDSSVKVNM